MSVAAKAFADAAADLGIDVGGGAIPGMVVEEALDEVEVVVVVC